MRDRLGLRAIFSDYAASWTVQSGDAGRRDKRDALAVSFGVPTVLAGSLYVHRVQLSNLSALISGVALFTGLLFGLLILMFNTGITLRKDGEHFRSAHDLPLLIADLRASITWAILVSMSLTVVLVVAASTTPSNEAACWGWTVASAWLFSHLAITVLGVLRRLRTAFNYITR